MLILSRVCVEFRSLRGVPLFEVTPRMINTFQDAPEAIREDPIFSLLIADGSLEAVVPAERQKELENDPIQDTDATGKRKVTEPKKTSTPGSKASAVSNPITFSETTPSETTPSETTSSETTPSETTPTKTTPTKTTPSDLTSSEAKVSDSPAPTTPDNQISTSSNSKPERKASRK